MRFSELVSYVEVQRLYICECILHQAITRPGLNDDEIFKGIRVLGAWSQAWRFNRDCLFFGASDHISREELTAEVFAHNLLASQGSWWVWESWATTLIQPHIVPSWEWLCRMVNGGKFAVWEPPHWQTLVPQPWFWRPAEAERKYSCNTQICWSWLLLPAVTGSMQDYELDVV